MTGQDSLFDQGADLAAHGDLDVPLGRSLIAQDSARVEFFAGLLSAWSLRDGEKATAEDRAEFERIARAALETAQWFRVKPS